MYARARTTTIATILAFGAAGLLLIPGSEGDRARTEAPQAAEIPAFFDDLNRGADKLLATGPVEISSSVEPDAGLIRERMQVAAIAPAPVVSSPAASAEELAPPAPKVVLRTDSIASAVNLRSGPGTGTGKLGVLTAGEGVSVLSQSGGWVEVALADGRAGWVYGTYLTSAGPRPVAAPPARAVEAKATISGGEGDLTGRTARLGSRLQAYEGPSSRSDVVFTIKAGTRVRILEQRGGWLLVDAPQGSAWIRAS